MVIYSERIELIPRSIAEKLVGKVGNTILPSVMSSFAVPNLKKFQGKARLFEVLLSLFS